VPELPEVETQCRDLCRLGIPGSRIVDTSVFWERTLGGLSAEKFHSTVKNCEIIRIYRRGKYLCLELTNDLHLLIHLRMSGSLRMRATGKSADKHDRVILHLNSTNLVFHDPRKFGRVFLTSKPHEILGRLGSEPLDHQLPPENFHTLLTSRKRILKPLLLDQSCIAGLGNIYVDEALFVAQLHPQRQSDSLTYMETRMLLTSIRRVLKNGIKNRGTSLGNGDSNFSSDGHSGLNSTTLQVFQRAGKPCPRCGKAIERIIVGQRGTHYCPDCQLNRKE
jgi:formamidopyrimidine-DNA glycosylase